MKINTLFSRTWFSALAAVAAWGSWLMSPTVHAASFTPGNLVVYRVGDGTSALVTTGNPVFLDEYTPTGTLVQSIAMPVTSGGGNNPIVASGTASSEGLLTRSTDGRYLILTGYGSTIPSSASLTSSSSATVPRIVGRVDAGGAIDTSTSLTDFSTGSNPRAAASVDGTNFWVGGGAGGVRYATYGGGATSTQLSTTVTNIRQVEIFGGQLYMSSASGAFRLASVGTGLPTAAGQTITNLPGFPTSTGSPYGFFFTQLNSGGSGVDTVYVADDGGTIQKYCLSGGTWTAKGTVAASGVRGIVGVVSGTNVTLYGATGASSSTGGGSLYTMTDTSGYNAAITGTLSTIATLSTTSNEAFRGLALAPQSATGSVRVETAADGSGTVLPGQSFGVGNSITVYAVTRSPGNAFLANAAATWSLSSITGGVVSGDLVPAGDGRSATFNPHAAGSAVIHAAVSGLTSVDSGVINATTSNPSGFATTATGNVALGQNVVITLTVTPGANPASTGITVTGDLSAIGGSSTQAFTAGPGNTYTFSASIPANLGFGSRALSFSIQDAQSRIGTATLSLNVLGNLTIFHTNDTHARITPHRWVIPQHTSNPQNFFELVGGFAYLGGEMISLANGQPDALVLDGGDISEGNPVGDWNGPGTPTGTFGNGTAVNCYKLMDSKLRLVTGRGGRGIDAMVIGNHDVRDISYINNLKDPSIQFPVISINVCTHGTHTPYFQPYTIINVNGNKVGVIGYTTESSEVGATLQSTIDIVKCDWSSSDSTKIHFADYVNTLRNTMGCNLVILLTHDGHQDLCTPNSSGSTPILADNSAAVLPEIAVTGHWHTWCETVWQPTILNYKTTFTEAASFMHYIGELRVNGQGQYMSVASHVLRNADITPDPDIANLIQTAKANFDATNPPWKADQIIGYSADDLLLDNYMKWWSSDEYPWSGNNTAGNWICDGMLWKATQLFGACDLCFESGGGVRSDIPAGAITYTNIYETYPWADDTIYAVNMTGQEIYNYFKGHGCDVGMSKGWFVTALDGVPTSITYNGQPVDLAKKYKVVISNYMYAHDTVPFSDPSPLTSTYLARTALVEFTSQYSKGNPYHAGASRYSLNTDFSGGYNAVVTMMNDNDSKEYFDYAFVRFLNADTETMGHLGSPQVPGNLVNPDGTINQSNRLAENQIYRSYLGFRTGSLKPGDIIHTFGKGGFYGGNPEFVDQEGITSNGVEFNIVGHDASLAQPSFVSSISGFWNAAHLNHYVRFFAKKTAASQVTDQSGTSISVQDVTAFSAKTLPGNVGDLLVLTGIPTSESFGLRLRCDSAALASSIGVSGYPPDSHVNAVTYEQTASSLNLTAMASVAPGTGSTIYTLSAVADSQVAKGSPTTNNGTKTFLFVQSSSTDSFQDERSWLRFDLSSIPAGTTITSAKLNMYCWKALGADLPTALCGGTDDTWVETAINWNTQPAFGAALDTQTLVSGATNTWYTWDATAFAQSQFSSDKLVSLLLKPVTEGSSDATVPSYAFESRDYTANTPYLQVTAPSSGGAPATVSQVQFFYRYSADNTTWGAWTAFQTVTTAPWNATFTYPSGFGYYQFYSVATDSTGGVEPAPPYADTAVHYTAGFPALVVEQPSGTPLTNGGSTVNFGAAVTGTVLTQTFTIRNAGSTPLTGVKVALDGENDDEYALTTPPATSLSPGASSTFVITVTPAACADRSAAVTINSNDPANDPFVINLLGTGLSNLDAWRASNFSNSSNTGNGADDAMPQGDGVSNLMKFATGMDPTKHEAAPGTATQSGGNILFTYIRNKAAVTDGIIFTVEWTDDLTAGSWSTTGVSESTVDQGATELVTDTIPMGSSGHRFTHLKVSRP